MKEWRPPARGKKVTVAYAGALMFGCVSASWATGIAVTCKDGEHVCRAEDEGRTWCRGKHINNTRVGRALLAAFLLRAA